MRCRAPEGKLFRGWVFLCAKCQADEMSDWFE
jgi:hypothetical protein